MEGGKGSGKSDCILFEALRQIEFPRYKALIIRRTFPQLQELIDRAHGIYPKLDGKWEGEAKRFVFPSGASIHFGHCQNEVDKERYQGHEYTFIGFDQLEQFLESQYNFISAQNRSSDSNLKCYIRATANPGSIGHWWIKRRFVDNKVPGKTYTDSYTFPDGRQMTRTFARIHATIYDNPSLLRAQPIYLANLMSLPEAERKAYLEGDWNAFTSECVFDRNGMAMQESKIETPKWVGYLKEVREGYEIVPDDKGNLKIWETPKFEGVYFLAADVAEGDQSGDYSSIHVVDKRSLRVVAIWHGHLNPMQFADVIDALGRYYNTAEVAVEIPGPGIATLGKLVEMKYPQLYKHDENKFGWRTDMSSRNNLVATFLEAIHGAHVTVRDRDTLDEMYNLVRNPRTMKIEARTGTFDDRFMSLGIALQCIRVNPFFEPRPRDRMGFRSIPSVITKSTTLLGRRRATGY